MVKAISLPQDVPITSDRRLIGLENQFQLLMKAHLAPKPSIQVNKVASSCEICSGPHDTQYCMENLEQAFVNYASSRNNGVGSKPFTINQEPRYFNEATNAWKDKPNFNWVLTQTFTSPSNGSFSTYSSNVPYGPPNYHAKIKRVLSNFDYHQENRLSSLRTQLKQQQDEVINKINTLWKVVSDKFDNATTRDIDKNSMVHANVVSHNHQESRAPPNKGIIKNPSKLFSPKYQAQSSLGEENGNSSSSKRVYFVNTITIVRKEDEPKGTRILKSNAIESENRNFAVEDDKMIEKESKDYKILVKEEEPYDIGNDNKTSDLEDEAFKDNTEIEKEGEWMEYEPPLDLVDVHDESV
ncbi:hypothetical protein Tco_0276920 [Tanacetum coccineum]